MKKPAKTIEFLDAIKAAYQLPSYYAVSKKLGITRSAVSNYRNGKSYFDDDMALTVADLLDLPPGYVLACIYAERTKSAPIRKVWRDIASKVASILLVVLALANLASTPSPALAQVSDFEANNGILVVSNDVYYVKCCFSLDSCHLIP